MNITLRQFGILLVIAGTAFLAFSVRTKKQHESGPYLEVAKRAAKMGMIQTTETTIDRRLFWPGLLLVAIGSLLQW